MQEAPKLDFIKIPIGHLLVEDDRSGKLRYSHPHFCRKVPKGAQLSDYSMTEKLIELEYSDGCRRWFDLSMFFGIVIAEVKDIFVLQKCGRLDPVEIISIESYKVKRTNYMMLIFQDKIPF